MHIIAKLAVVASCLAASVPLPAPAATASCNIVGNFTDTQGSVGKFTSDTKGKVLNTKVCPVAYHLTVTKLNAKVLHLTGKAPSAEACPALSGSFSFEDSCSKADGTVTLGKRKPVDDTLTFAGTAAAETKAPVSALSAGLQ